MEALLAFLSTVAGKAVAGTAVAAASVAGMQAADVDLPLPDLSDKPAEVTTDDQGETPVLPTESEKGQEAADAKGDNAAIAEEKRQNAEAEAENEDANDVDAADSEANNFGQDVADLAQDPESDGEDVSTYARENNPGVAHRTEAGAPEDAGERQDATVRPEQSYQGEDGGEAEAGAEESDLDGDQAEPAGSAATGDENRGGAAAAGARP